MQRRFLVGFLTLIGASIRPAAACIDIAPFVVDDIREAELVVSGELVGYARIQPDPSRPISSYALVTVRVDSILRGKSPPTVQLTWDNSTFNEPEFLTLGEEVIVAAVSPRARPLKLRVASATIFPAPREDKMRVLQAPCSSPFLLPYSAQSEINLRKVLNGEETPNHDYFAGSERLYATNQWNMRLISEMRPLFLALVLVILSSAAVIMVRRRKRARLG